MDGEMSGGEFGFLATDTSQNMGQFGEGTAAVETFDTLDTIEVAQTSGGSSYKQMLSTIFDLSDDDLQSVAEHVRDKLVRNGESFLQQHDNLRAAYEKFKIEYEQRFIELESDFNECQSKLTVESKNSYLFRLKANENGLLSLLYRFIILQD
jgi:hypothetical protein